MVAGEKKVKNTAGKTCQSRKTNGWAGSGHTGVKKAIIKKKSAYAEKKALKEMIKAQSQADEDMEGVEEEKPKVRP